MELNGNNYSNLNRFAELFGSMNGDNIINSFFDESSMSFKLYKKEIIDLYGLNSQRFLCGSKVDELHKISDLFANAISETCESILINPNERALPQISKLLTKIEMKLNKVSTNERNLKLTIEKFVNNAKSQLKMAADLISQKNEEIKINRISEKSGEINAVLSNVKNCYELSKGIESQIENLNQQIALINRELKEVYQNNRNNGTDDQILELIIQKSEIEQSILNQSKDYGLVLKNLSESNKILGELLELGNKINGIKIEDLIIIANSYIQKGKKNRDIIKKETQNKSATVINSSQDSAEQGKSSSKRSGLNEERKAKIDEKDQFGKAATVIVPDALMKVANESIEQKIIKSVEIISKEVLEDCTNPFLKKVEQPNKNSSQDSAEGKSSSKRSGLNEERMAKIDEKDQSGKAATVIVPDAIMKVANESIEQKIIKSEEIISKEVLEDCTNPFLKKEKQPKQIPQPELLDRSDEPEFSISSCSSIDSSSSSIKEDEEKPIQLPQPELELSEETSFYSLSSCSRLEEDSDQNNLPSSLETPPELILDDIPFPTELPKFDIEPPTDLHKESIDDSSYLPNDSKEDSDQDNLPISLEMPSVNPTDLPKFDIEAPTDLPPEFIDDQQVPKELNSSEMQQPISLVEKLRNVLNDRSELRSPEEDSDSDWEISLKDRLRLARNGYFVNYPDRQTSPDSDSEEDWNV